MRFIRSVVDGELVVSNRKKAELLQELSQAGYELFDARCAYCRRLMTNIVMQH